MSNVTSAPVTAVAAATKYRVEIRHNAVDAGWAFEQIATGTDRFEREGVVVAVHHGPGDRITHAEKVTADSYDAIARGSGKKFWAVRGWLTGAGIGTKYVALSSEQVARFESQQGLAKIVVIEAPTVQAPAVEEAPKAEVEAPVEAPKPKARARAKKTGPSNEERQAAKDAEHIAQM